MLRKVLIKNFRAFKDFNLEFSRGVNRYKETQPKQRTKDDLVPGLAVTCLRGSSAQPVRPGDHDR